MCDDSHQRPLLLHSATGWGNDCIQFKLSHNISPGWLASIAEGDRIINATLLYLLTTEAILNTLTVFTETTLFRLQYKPARFPATSGASGNVSEQYISRSS